MWQRRTIFFMTVFFISGMMGVSAFADSDSETKTCKESHVPVERTNGKIVCMTERTAERTVERFGWIILDHTLGEPNKTVISDAILIQDDLTITTKQFIHDDPDSVPSNEIVKPKQTKAIDEEKTTTCLNDTCVDLSSGEDVSVEVETPVYTHKTKDGKFVIEKEQQTMIFRPVVTPYEYVLPEGCTPTEGVMEWGARYQGSKILADLQNMIDSGETRLCVTIFVDVTMEDFDHDHPDYGYPNYIYPIYNYPNTEVRNNLYEFLVQRGADVEGKIDLDGKKENSKRSAEVIDAAIPLSFLDELVNRDDVVNIDLMGKSTSTPYHIKLGYDSKIHPLLQKEIEFKQQNCTLEEDFPDECPRLEKNADGKYLVRISIRTDTFDSSDVRSQLISEGVNLSGMGYSDRYKKIIHPELEKRNMVIIKPLLDSFKENNLDVKYGRYVHVIYTTVPIDFLSELVNHDLVDMIQSGNMFGSLH